MNILHRLMPHRLLLGASLLLGSGAIALAAITPDVAKTRHNLSASNIIGPTGSFGATVKATSETQICVFCHTPHAATSGIVAPLWNRALSSETYTFYSSASLDSPVPGAVGIGSKLCLSCHDGTLAIGTVGVLNNAPGNIAMQGTGTGGVMPDGAGASTGFTRNTGINLTNDHPISFTYDAALAAADGELYAPAATTNVAVANRMRGQPKPQFPLIGGADKFGGQMECITCHDPHLKTDAIDVVTGLPVNNKFLRGNRFQSNAMPVDNSFNPDNDIICLACHNKTGWATSTHANSMATEELYTDTAADLRDFPRNTTVWQTACLSCHDVHTVPGSRRLLREGVDTASLSPKAGGNPATEETCYQCHSPAGTTTRALLDDLPDQVPDVQTDFGRTYRMPIVTAEQGQVPAGGGSTTNPTSPGEIHDIGKSATGSPDTDFGTSNVSRGKDMLETRTQLGAGALTNRHAECPDCHQPHRVTRTQLFNDNPSFAALSGTHNHTGTAGGGVMHSNLASGSQRGAFGVEPQYGTNSFYDEPTSFIEKRGPVSNGASTAVGNTWLTREYQICAKCHSNYGFGNLVVGQIANPANIPALGGTGGTPDGTNGLHFYTNVFREIQAPLAHQGNATPGDSGAHNGMTPYQGPASYAVNFTTNNRRSWHPVMGPTGRHPEPERHAFAGNWLAPWTNDVGDLTMYCTDCHGSNTPARLSEQPTDGPPEGPHGSTNIFILKGWWDSCTGASANVQGCLDDPLVSTNTVPKNAAVGANRPTTDTTQDLCFKCHDYDIYAGGKAGFSGFGNGNNLHAAHASSYSTSMRCMWCHIAVPHGWKNKAFLVNLNDVGPEAMCRQEDADDLPDGYKCTVGQPMSPGTQMRNGPLTGGVADTADWIRRGYSNPPYYRNALLKIASFAPSGSWIASNCASIGLPGSNAGFSCGGWMGSLSEGCGGSP